MSKNRTVVLLGGRGSTTNIVYNYLRSSIGLDVAIIESRPSKLTLVKRRLKTLGVYRTFGQVLFQIAVPRFLKAISKQRLGEILNKYNLDPTDIPYSSAIYVESVNSEEVISKLQELSPDIIIVNGTRIISETVLNAVSSVFINIHAGITPLYRGVHGGYWAVAEGRLDACGVTVHLVDKGIDTGGVLRQGSVTPEDHDNFITLPYLQLGVGLPLLVDAVRGVLDEDITVSAPLVNESKLRTHPTLTEYVANYIRNGAK